MRIIKIKNNTESTITYAGQEILSGEYYQIQNETELSQFLKTTLLSDINPSVNNPVISMVNDGESDLSYEDGQNWLLDLHVKSVTVQESPPFAKPDYRTKFSKTAAIENAPKNDSTNIDFQLTKELYIFGGEGVVKNAEYGDYITAEIYDKDSVIPEAYRASLCEDWPTVAEYADLWIMVTDLPSNNPFTKIHMNTYPLIAKISAGLYLRITYHAIDAGETRQIAMNYFLDKKL